MIHDVFDDVHDCSTLRIEGRRDSDRNLPPLLHLRVQDVWQNKGFDWERISFSETALSPGREFGFEALFDFDLAPFLGARFKGVGLP